MNDTATENAARLQEWIESGYGQVREGSPYPSDMARWHFRRLSNIVAVETDGDDAHVQIMGGDIVTVGSPVKHYGQRYTGCLTGIVTGFEIKDNHMVKVCIRPVNGNKFRARYYAEADGERFVVKDSFLDINFSTKPKEEHTTVVVCDDEQHAEEQATQMNLALLETVAVDTVIYGVRWDWDRTQTGAMIG